LKLYCSGISLVTEYSSFSVNMPLQVNGSGRHLLYINEDNFNAPERYRTIVTSEGVTLLIAGVTKEDDAIYECNVQKSGLQAMASVTVLG